MRRTAEHLSARRVTSLLVASLFVYICSAGATPDKPTGQHLPFIGNVYASTDGYYLPAQRTADVTLITPHRPSPTPLPEPIPVDPDATPLPGPATPIVRGYFQWPVVAEGITQYFSAYHLAVDIAAPYGANVHAADGGTVIYSGWKNNGGGYVVDIDHGNGFVTSYNHLSALYVSAGQWVNQGDPIAAIGCTGNCTGPHLHFAVIHNGVLVNPLAYLP